MPAVTIDETTHAVTFTFAAPPAADVRGTIGGVSLADLINPPYISGGFADAIWAGTRAGEAIGDFEVTSSGNTVTVTTSNDSGSVFDANHESLTIGISDPSGCYSLSPAVPFARPPVNELWTAKRLLDAGVLGVSFPFTSTPELARQAVAACRYPPRGLRGSGAGLAQFCWPVSEGYYDFADNNVLVVAVVEDIPGLTHIDEIASTPALT